MSILFSLPFWFNLRPGSMDPLPRNIFIAFIIILIALAITTFIAKRKKGSYRRFFISLYNFCISNAIIGLMLLFFNYEIVPFFSAYFWYLIWFIIMLIWKINILLALKKNINSKKEQTENNEIKKYLP